MIVEIEVTLILDTEDDSEEAYALVAREIRTRGLIAGRVCAVKARGYVMDHEYAREYLKP